MDLAIQFMSQFTPFANIHATDDYAQVLARLVDWIRHFGSMIRYLSYDTLSEQE
ncbi:hypothetical protein M404DRAFT_997059 [Pisolithus tinctorius Marx 270]|uniref:Uncharacterized protein n=1 Tax=Pisolithus tinctorius Marx 270 TaxID=870435 RepID=A0A0C3P6F3_PISTI|nr:hypothetical protein M404DRAFT_997059 [Pisolithus tinctorius Marx 270]